MERLAAMAKTMLRLGGACGPSNVVRCLLYLFLFYRLGVRPTRKFYWGQRGFGADYSSDMIVQDVARQQAVTLVGR